jgi:uncharacterized protein (DUF58 family)
MLTKYSLKFITIFIFSLLIGLILGNRIIIAMSLLPVSFILGGIILESPGDVLIQKTWDSSRIWVGDIIEIRYEVTVNKGFGPVFLLQELPAHFALIEGNNFQIFWKGWHPRNFTFSYKICCTKRGIYNFLPVKWESNQVLKLTQPHQGESGEPIEIQVHPKILNIRRVRNLKGISSVPIPVNDMAKIGVATTDFREIRNYVYGDPIKNINWKATARSSSPEMWPLTNEYEVEGKKTVWLFLDTARELEIGTNINNAFEYCIEAANAITYYYINQGYRVGMYVFNGGGELLYPDAGKKQFLKISRHLLDLRTGTRNDEFLSAIEKSRQYILGHTPLCVIITGLDSKHANSITAGVKQLHQMLGRGRRRLPIMIVNIAGYNIMPTHREYDENACALLNLKTRPTIQQLRRSGASVLDWSTFKESFGTALIKQMRGR